jgi:hypothetical protein
LDGPRFRGMATDKFGDAATPQAARSKRGDAESNGASFTPYLSAP